MNKLKSFLPQSVLLHIYNSLILPYLTYGAIIWESCANRLLVLQKKAIRAITKSKYNAHTERLFRTLKLLKCPDICALQCYKFCYRLENKSLPQYFSGDFFIKNSSRHDYPTSSLDDFYVPRVQRDFSKLGVRYKIPVFFNAIDSDIKDIIYTHGFDYYKYYVKQKIIDTYTFVCTDTTCPSC